MTTPVVSVILPTKNRTSLLPVSAGSVLNQSHRDLELIVVDDGSEEDVTAAVAGLNDPRARCVRREKSGGPAAARNTGLEHATGRYLAFQDSDDEWLPGKLELQVAAVEERPGSMSICALLRNFEHHTRLYGPPSNSHGGPITFAQIAFRPRAYTQTWLVPRSAVTAAGGFDERLKVWDDWELLLRLAERVEIRPLEEPLAISKQSPDSISRDVERFRHDLNLILAKHSKALAAHPRSAASLQHVFGRLSVSTGDLAAARRAFLAAMRLRPAAPKSWALLMSTFFGPFVAKYVVSARRPVAPQTGRP